MSAPSALHLSAVELPGGQEHPTMAAIAARCANPLRVTSVLDLIAQVQGRLGSDRFISCLDIVGHGEPGVLSVGALPDCGPGHRLSGDPASYGYLGALRERFAADGRLRLLGCETACRVPGSAMGDGPLLLLALARFLSVPVSGPLRPVAAGDFDGFFVADEALLTLKPGDLGPIAAPDSRPASRQTDR